MVVKILYFAWLRERLGVGEEHIPLPENVATIGDLAAWLILRGRGFAEVFANPRLVRVAVNQNFAGFDALVADGDEIAFFPPVTGG